MLNAAPNLSVEGLGFLGGGVISLNTSGVLLNRGSLDPLNWQPVLDTYNLNHDLFPLRRSAYWGFYERMNPLGEFSPLDADSSNILIRDLDILPAEFRNTSEFIMTCHQIEGERP